MSEERLELIETKLAYQEDTIQALNDLVAAQQEKITYLEALILRLSERMHSVSEQSGSFDSTEIPPHY